MATAVAGAGAPPPPGGNGGDGGKKPDSPPDLFLVRRRKTRKVKVNLDSVPFHLRNDYKVLYKYIRELPNSDYKRLQARYPNTQATRYWSVDLSPGRRGVENDLPVSLLELFEHPDMDYVNRIQVMTDQIDGTTTLLIDLNIPIYSIRLLFDVPAIISAVEVQAGRQTRFAYICAGQACWQSLPVAPESRFESESQTSTPVTEESEFQFEVSTDPTEHDDPKVPVVLLTRVNHPPKK